MTKDNTQSEQTPMQMYRSKNNFSGNREKVIERDGSKCVRCSITRQKHKEIYNRDITVDHIDGRGTNTPIELKNNNLNNLQTLCLSCHGRKDTKTTKLTETQVINIMHCRGEISAIKLGKMYGVFHSTISDIWRGDTWKHLTVKRLKEGL